MTMLGVDIWLPIGLSNPYNFLTAVKATLKSRPFYCRGLTRICTTAQDGEANPEIVYCFLVHRNFQSWKEI